MSAGRQAIVRVSVLILAVVLASAFFAGCYCLDNKYTAYAPESANGVVMLDEGQLQDHPSVQLVRGWEIYRGSLLEPADFAPGKAPPLPDEVVFVGQYGGFEGGRGAADPQANPHGAASYRLILMLPDEVRSYALELPEIYSAYRLYVNGALAAEMGRPEQADYLPETGNGLVVFQAGGKAEILLAAADYSHIYSGLVYPPAFGSPAAVTTMLNIRYGLRAAFCAVGIFTGLLCLFVYALIRKRGPGDGRRALPLWYGLLCFCFCLYTCYPLVKTLASSGLGWYTVENLAYCCMFMLVVRILELISGARRALAKAFYACGAAACLAVLLSPLVLGDSVPLMMAFSLLIGAYTWFGAVCLTLGAALCVRGRTAHSTLLLAGIAVFDVALVMDRLLPLYEPVYGGWFVEAGGAAMILLIGVAIASDIARQYRMREALEGRVQDVTKMLEVQNAYYPIVLQKEGEAKAARHDLRHHVVVMRDLVASNDLARLSRYLDDIADPHAPVPQGSYCEHYVADMLLRYYASLAKEQGTGFEARVRMPREISVEDVDLCVILSNLLENALESCARIPEGQRWVSLVMRCEMSMLGILMDNSFDGNAERAGRGFWSRKQGGREGIGLVSVQSVAERYGGSAEFSAEGEVFHSKVLLFTKENG